MTADYDLGKYPYGLLSFATRHIIGAFLVFRATLLLATVYVFLFAAFVENIRSVLRNGRWHYSWFPFVSDFWYWDARDPEIWIVLLFSWIYDWIIALLSGWGIPVAGYQLYCLIRIYMDEDRVGACLFRLFLSQVVMYWFLQFIHENPRLFRDPPWHAMAVTLALPLLFAWAIHGRKRRHLSRDRWGIGVSP